MVRNILIVFILLFMANTCPAAVEFDDTDDSICSENIDQTGMPTENPVTFIAVVYPTSVTGSNTIAEYGERVVTASGWRFQTIGDELIILTSGVNTYTSTALTVVINEWQCVAAALDSADDATFYHYRYSTATLESETIAAVNDANAPAATSDLLVGAQHTDTTEACSTPATFWSGKISDVAIYSKALSQAEVEMFCKSQVKRTGLQISNRSVLFTLDSQPDGSSADGDTFTDLANGKVLTGSDGANNTGLTAKAEEILTYP